MPAPATVVDVSDGDRLHDARRPRSSTSTATGARPPIEIDNFAATDTGVDRPTGLADGADAAVPPPALPTLRSTSTVDGGTRSTVAISADGCPGSLATSTASRQRGRPRPRHRCLQPRRRRRSIDRRHLALRRRPRQRPRVTISGTTHNVDGTSASTDGTDTARRLDHADRRTPSATNSRVQYNDLLDQIDQLAKDAGFNGVNLLNGDNLSVLFNEDGTSQARHHRRDLQRRRPRPHAAGRRRLRHQRRHQRDPRRPQGRRPTRCAPSRRSSVRTSRWSKPARTSPRR